MSDDPTQDAHSLGIALRLAQAQNRELRKQLATATEALKVISTYAGADDPNFETRQQAMADIEARADEALAAIKPNQGEHP